jgi:serine/threonine protein phosphatase 1
MGRIIAIGDIHGCAAALRALLTAIRPQPKDAIVTLGDYIDRGPDSRGVIERILALSRECQVVALRGNHEAMLLEAWNDSAAIRKWLTCGGTDALRSYGWSPGGPKRTLASWFPDRHRTFIAETKLYHETATHVFVHAGLLPQLPLDRQPEIALLWRVTDPDSGAPHVSGKVVVVGHTPQSSGEVLDLGFLVNIDTNCVRGGWLTALDVESRQVWQADANGKLRPDSR